MLFNGSSVEALRPLDLVNTGWIQNFQLCLTEERSINFNQYICLHKPACTSLTLHVLQFYRVTRKVSKVYIDQSVSLRWLKIMTLTRGEKGNRIVLRQNQFIYKVCYSSTVLRPLCGFSRPDWINCWGLRWFRQSGVHVDVDFCPILHALCGSTRYSWTPWCRCRACPPGRSPRPRTPGRSGTRCLCTE